ncbi:TetR family transcriptional regulator [Epidermidibacterium keratini]|uniref:TetR family transcriptional regulator n=1 Tax=Epidermidibacterium keratini TaxID=1891644 RepID=A0A7L4YM59_9ACTN|nr:TetR/AcrR family transcriptional regulator [Epidermidibacterium keratini]QHB99908.1 TetR family transcriptional regulator [Epidermidibacterium keratini]
MSETTEARGDARVDQLTAKARRTRERLVLAARTVFERDGFLNARVMDVTEEAKVAHGTFYTYFDSKTDIFRALLLEFMPGIYDHAASDKSLTRIQRIERGNLQFYSVYKENLRLFGLLEQATTFDDEIHSLRIQLRHRAENRVLGMIRGLQAKGILDSALKAEIVASALIAMTTHSFYTWHITEDRDYDIEQANRTLTYLWAGALGLEAEAEDDTFYQSLGRGKSAKQGRKRSPRKTAPRKTAPSERAR